MCVCECQFYQIPQAGPQVQWPWELNVPRLKKTHSNRQNMSKLRKHLHQFHSRCTTVRNNAAKWENTSKYRQHIQVRESFEATPLVVFSIFIWLCFRFLQRLSAFVRFLSVFVAHFWSWTAALSVHMVTNFVVQSSKPASWKIHASVMSCAVQSAWGSPTLRCLRVTIDSWSVHRVRLCVHIFILFL